MARTRGRLIFLMLLWMAIWLSRPAAADASGGWTIQPPAQTAVPASSTLVLGVPAGLSPAVIARLGVEIDNIDVTALVHIGGGKLSYDAPQPFEAGRHELRVVEYAADGHMIPRGVWVFTVKPQGADRGWSVKGSVGLTVSERLAQSNMPPPAPSPFSAGGTFDVKAVAPMAKWTAGGSINGLYGSNTGAAITGQAIQPAQMQLSLRHGKDSLILGDQTLPYNNLMISGLSRRGISIHVDDMPLGADATAFSVRDSSLAGFHGGFGFTDANDNISGAVLRAHPLKTSPEALTLFAGFITGTSPAGLSIVTPYPGANSSMPPGQSSMPGASMVTPVQAGAGSAWAVGLDSHIPDSPLHLNGQYAASAFDFPGIPGQGATRATDDAYSLGLNYSHPLGRQWAFGASVNYQDVGTFFSSLANPALAPDQRTATAGGTLSGHGFAIAPSGGFTEDNTDNNNAIATVRSLPLSVTVSYGPALPASVTSWLGAPSLSLAWQNAHTYNITLPAGATPTDAVTTNSAVTLNFAYIHWSWSAGLVAGSFRDHTGQQDNTNNLGPTLGFNTVIGKTGSVGFNVQIVNTHDDQQNTDTVDQNYALTAGDSFLSGKLTSQLTLAINHNTQQAVPGVTPQPANSATLRTAMAQLTWHALQATPKRGGLDVALAGSWNESSGLNSAVLAQQGFSSLSATGYQMFLTISTTWPIAIGAGG